MSSQMQPRFHGASRQKIDDKGRVHLPRRWEQQLAGLGDLILTATPQRCLLLMACDRWEEAATRLEDRPLGAPRDRWLRFLFIGHCEAVVPDKAGRIVIPQALRKLASMDEEDKDTLYLVGTGQDIQFWSADRWSAAIASACEAEQLFTTRSDSSTPSS